MQPSHLGRLGRALASSAGHLGIVVFAGALLGCVGILMEGVTHRFGEGEVMRPESPEQTRNRLVVLAWLAGAVVAGWVTARLGDFYLRPEGRPRAARLIAELLLVVGGLGTALALLITWGHRLAAYEVAPAYRRVGDVALVGGPALLVLGWLLYRWGRRQRAPEKTEAPKG